VTAYTVNFIKFLPFSLALSKESKGDFKLALANSYPAVEFSYSKGSKLYL
jgi:hypothetical protein